MDEEERVRLLGLQSRQQALFLEGYRHVAGIDEAGRGPLAGPVVAAACIIPLGRLIAGIDDSKRLSLAQRERIYCALEADPEVAFGVGSVSADQIDAMGILSATKRAMLEAVASLPSLPDYLLIDALDPSHPTLPTETVIKGDQRCYAIAAASIVAKVSRDRLMIDYDRRWPAYGFARHKGYGTALHLAALKQHGPCPIHRRSFSPVQVLEPCV